VDQPREREVRLENPCTPAWVFHRKTTHEFGRKPTPVCVGFRTKRDPALCHRIKSSVAESGSLSPDREIYGRMQLSVAGSGDLWLDPALCRQIGSSAAEFGSLWLDLSLSDVVSVRNSPVVGGLEFGRWIET
jgi:hypothetical protein